MFKVGDKVVCIDSSNSSKYRYSNSIDNSIVFLTVGCLYTISHVSELVFVENDIGEIGGYYESRFISMIDYRKLKLERLKEIGL